MPARAAGLVKGRLLAGLLLTLFGFALTFGILEVAVRVLVQVDADGNSWIGQRQLPAYHIPVQLVRSLIGSYETSADSFTMYDAQLGWTVRPDSVSLDRVYQSNSKGLRSESSPLDLKPAN